MSSPAAQYRKRSNLGDKGERLTLACIIVVFIAAGIQTRSWMLNLLREKIAHCISRAIWRDALLEPGQRFQSLHKSFAAISRLAPPPLVSVRDSTRAKLTDSGEDYRNSLIVWSERKRLCERSSLDAMHDTTTCVCAHLCSLKRRVTTHTQRLCLFFALKHAIWARSLKSCRNRQPSETR